MPIGRTHPVRARTSSQTARTAKFMQLMAACFGLTCFCLETSAQDSGALDDQDASVVQIEPAPLIAPAAASCPPPDGTRPDPTLVNTDSFVLARFPLQRVFAQLVRLARSSRQTPLELYQRMWDSMDVGAEAKFEGPHCDDHDPPSTNGFPIECPRPESVLKDSSFDAFVPVALMNRFDLSPADGANCGEYRMIFAMTPFDLENRNFIIFEGVLDNPNPSCGIEACRPVVNFWESLSRLDPNTASGQRALADRLEYFYFNGLPGFNPVIHPNQFGLQGRGGYGGVNGGQIRTNMFVTGKIWQLREFRLMQACRHRRCELQFEPVTVKNNPFPALFNPLAVDPDPRGEEFRDFFSSQVESLANDDINAISMQDDDRFNAGQSTSQNLVDDYLSHAIFGLANGPNDFTRAIRTELVRIGRDTDVTPLDIVVRAETQSCAGCHMLTRRVPLSGDGTAGPVWPDVRPDGFVHVDEQGFLSPALWCDFLPFRKSVLDGFAVSPARSCRAGRATRPPRTVITRFLSRDAAHGVSEAEADDDSAAPITVCGKRFGPN